LISEEHSSVDILGPRLEALLPELYTSPAIEAYPKNGASDISTELLVGVRCGQEHPALFHIDSSVVTRITGEPRVIGYGPLQEMATELWSLDLDVNEACTAALFLAHEAKRRYGGAGGVTHILKLCNNGAVDFERTWDQGAREALLNDIRTMYQRLVITIATASLKPEVYTETMKKVDDRAVAIHGAFQKLESEYKEWFIKMIGGSVIKFEELPQHIQDHLKWAMEQQIKKDE
jgi:hypothetical protein